MIRRSWNLICPICHNEILSSDKKMLMSSDIPYFSLMVHKNCLLENYTTLGSRSQEFLEIYNSVSKTSKNVTLSEKTRSVV